MSEHYCLDCFSIMKPTHIGVLVLFDSNKAVHYGVLADILTCSFCGFEILTGLGTKIYDKDEINQLRLKYMVEQKRIIHFFD